MAATSGRISFITEEYRTSTSVDNAIKTKHPLAKIETLTTFLNEEANATTLGARVLALKKVDRQSWTVSLSSRFRFNLVLGATYTITHPRFGLASGKNFILRGVKWGSDSNIVDAIFYGPQ